MENVCRYYIFMCIPGLGAPSEKFKRPRTICKRDRNWTHHTKTINLNKYIIKQHG